MTDKGVDDLLSLLSVQELMRRFDAVGERLSQLASTVAVAAERERSLTNEITELNKTIECMDKRLKTLETSALKTAAGFTVIVAFGAIVGWLISTGKGLIDFFRALFGVSAP